MGVKKKKKSKDGKKSKPEKDVASAPDQTEAEQVTASKEPAAPSVHKYAFTRISCTSDRTNARVKVAFQRF